LNEGISSPEEDVVVLGTEMWAIRPSREERTRASRDFEVNIKKTKQESRLAAYAGKQQDWNVRLYPLHLPP
jgi:hypothetical protein